MRNRRQGTAPLLIILAGTLWGCTGLFVRSLTAAGFSNMQIVEMRCLLAAIMFVVIAVVHDRSALRIRLRDAWCFIGTGIVSVLFFFVCYYTTIEMTSLSVAAVLLYTAPIFVTVLSRLLFRECITARKLIALALSVIGCVFVSGVLADTPRISLIGILIGLGSGLGYALYSIFTRFALLRGYRPMTVAVYTFVLAAIGGAFIGDIPGSVRVVAHDPLVSVPLVMNALLSTVAAYLLYNIGLEHVENGKAVIMASVEPVVATIIGIAVFHEVPDVGNVIGMALVIVAIVLLNSGASPADDDDPDDPDDMYGPRDIDAGLEEAWGDMAEDSPGARDLSG